MNCIKALREGKNLTQEELCKKIGVSQSAIAKWENGDSLPRADKLPELAKILGCRIDDLFEKEVKGNEA